jgi:iron(III) transport system substrate-binding protein
MPGRASLLRVASGVLLLSGLAMSLPANPARAQTAPAVGDPFPQVSSELYAKAKQEQSLVVYTVWDVQHIVAMLQAFSKHYPGIKTDYWQARNPEIVTRVLTEFQAGRGSVDVILSDSSPPPLRAAGAILPYETVQKEFLITHDPTMPVVSMQIQVLAYNTKRMKAEDAPKTWEDVASSRYQGGVALDDPLRAGPLSHMVAALKASWNDDARWASFVQGLKALKVPVHRSTSAMFRLVIAGEYSVAMPALLHDVLSEKEKGSPIELVKTAPPIIHPRYAAIYAKAPHPHAAKLFAEWLISREGQAALDSVGREPARKGIQTKTSIEANFPATVRPLTVADKHYLEDPKKWLDTHVKPLWTP